MSLKSLRPVLQAIPRRLIIQSRTYITPTLLTRPTLLHLHLQPVTQRHKSTTPRSEWARNPIISYSELKPITQQPSDDVLIIDVREAEEVALGSIPSSVNLPLSELAEGLDVNSSQGEFNKKYAFPKPLSSQNIIFYCRSGKRSATASELASGKGYKNVRNYQGSWLDWEKNEKKRGDDY